jgi:hypothetical protein
MLARIILASCLLLTLDSGSRGRPGDDPGSGTSVVTLFANDEVRSAFSFALGDYGVEIADGEAVLDRAQIAFGIFEKDKLSVGFVRDEGARVVDLGDLTVPGYAVPADRAYHPPISVLYTLFVQSNTLCYRGPLGKTYRLSSADSVFFTLPPDGVRSFEPKVGHTYVMRYAPQGGQSTQQRFAKFRVIDFEPGRWITLRWASMVPVR